MITFNDFITRLSRKGIDYKVVDHLETIHGQLLEYGELRKQGATVRVVVEHVNRRGWNYALAEDPVPTNWLEAPRPSREWVHYEKGAAKFRIDTTEFTPAYDAENIIAEVMQFRSNFQTEIVFPTS